MAVNYCNSALSSFSLLIYFFVTKRQISFSYILTNMLFDIGIFYSVTAVLGLIIVASVQSITPTYATPILNYGGPIVYLIEIIITMPIIKKIQPALNYYSKTVLVQAPVLVWLFNLFLFFRIFLGINYINPIIKVSAPVHMLNGLLYVIIIVLFTQVTAKFYRYKNLTISQGAELTNLQAYTSHIETMYDDLRRFRHDYKNVLLSLEGAVSSGDIKEVQDIFQRVVKPTNTNLDDQTAVLSHLENIKNIEIKSLVYNKVMTAINDHIDVSVEVVEPFKISPKVKITDGVRIIAILFDNAINAAKKAPTKEINFSLFTKGSAQYIVIRNSTTEEKVDLHMLDGNFKGISSGRHSLGLRNLRIILASYSFIQHNSQSGNHSVTQEIIIH
ncbi:GHKL domain-containing protein [Limosilactobacillus reuteri]|uniref:Sensor histidine kinase NatK-like C-terminal domain-containing protein n=1 Tax=Limosilactobacillus reuteri subsp. rodentium (strain DSM 17509 / CIP 109821 / 100-23) TaxID=349123 RepID=B3XL76_LIMR1|nr:GHKL domain-containing protein [Limosilactobacillus reuteri]EDX43088.1 hypothetical protein Lreu23DRAFT_4607 [Limosilactobacillus reuteri subsp. rodentium]MCC4476611.1 GHKL domain-containing protein [Limosilactobacillus reuteri]